MRPIVLATDNSNDVFTFWTHHKQCGIHNRVEVLSDGSDVVRYLEGDRVRFPLPALLIASLKMPQMGGLQLLEHLRATGQRDFSTVLLTDAADHDLRLAMLAYRLGAASFLMRPIEKTEFCRLLCQFQAITMDGCPGIPTLSVGSEPD